MRYRLGDICTITKGKTGIMKAIPGAFVMVALGEANKTHYEYQFDTKAVIIPLVSSTGHGHASMKRVKYQEGKFALGNILCAVIPKDENFVLAKYLHIYLHWNREELLVSQMKGMANVSLPINKIADVIVTIPSITKQKEIISLEKKLVEKEDEADTLFADQLTQLSNLNQAILQEAVQGKLVPQDKKDEPASELLKRIKAEKSKSSKKEKLLLPIKHEEIPFEIPDSWVWCRLGEISDLISGQDFSPDDYSDIDSDGLPYITGASNIDNEEIIINRWTITPKSIALIGDLLLTCKGSGVGKNAILKIGKVHIARQIMAIRPVFVRIDYLQSIIILERKIYRGKAKSQIPGIDRAIVLNTLVPLPPLSEQKRIVSEIKKQLAKTKQLKEHIIANQQATEQLLKALLHQAFETKEETVEQPRGKVVEFKPAIVNLDALTANLFEEFRANPVNNIQDIDVEMAMMVSSMKSKLGNTYGDVGLQKNVYNTTNLQPIFSKQYGFFNSNFGTYCRELKQDLKQNPYLCSQNVANNKEVYVVNPKYSKQISDKLKAPENKAFVKVINDMLSIYEHPFINKETDKIELYNTVLKVALDKKTTDIESIYQSMKDWRINQAKFKTKAEKFSKVDAERMLKLLIDKGRLSK